MRTRLALDSGDFRNALLFAQQALASAQSDRNEDPLVGRYAIAGAYRALGDARQRSGDGKGAQDAWSKALAALPTGFAETPAESDEHALILERLGRAAEAQPLISRLKSIGYRRQT
jgi:tetratricopeptide (TPR) repeat protein